MASLRSAFAATGGLLEWPAVADCDGVVVPMVLPTAMAVEK